MEAKNLIQKFLKNEKNLAERFCFETLGSQLLLISMTEDRFGFSIPEPMKKTALALYNNLISKGVYNRNLENSLVTVQTNILREEFLTLIQKQLMNTNLEFKS